MAAPWMTRRRTPTAWCGAADRKRWASSVTGSPYDRPEVPSRVSNRSRAGWAHTGGSGMQGLAHGREKTPYRVRPDQNGSGVAGGSAPCRAGGEADGALGKKVMEIEILQAAREEVKKRPRFYTRSTQ